jgi:hypothetical protein
LDTPFNTDLGQVVRGRPGGGHIRPTDCIGSPPIEGGILAHTAPVTRADISVSDDERMGGCAVFIMVAEIPVHARTGRDGSFAASALPKSSGIPLQWNSSDSVERDLSDVENAHREGK